MRADDGSRTRDLRLGKPHRSKRRITTDHDRRRSRTRVAAVSGGSFRIAMRRADRDVWATIGPPREGSGMTDLRAIYLAGLAASLAGFGRTAPFALLPGGVSTPAAP